MIVSVTTFERVSKEALSNHVVPSPNYMFMCREIPPYPHIKIDFDYEYACFNITNKFKSLTEIYQAHAKFHNKVI